MSNAEKLQAKYIILGMLSMATPEEQAKVKDAAERILAIIKEVGSPAVAALAIVALEQES